MSRLTSKTIAVIGAGTMGRGITRTALRHGFGVAIFDVNSSAARQLAVDGAGDVAGGQDEPAGQSANAALVIASSIAEAVAGAAAIIESVVESEPVKAAVLHEAAQAADPGAL